MHIHTYPVDNSLSAEDAWHEIRLFGQRLTFTGGETWVNRECEGEWC